MTEQESDSIFLFALHIFFLYTGNFFIEFFPLSLLASLDPDLTVQQDLINLTSIWFKRQSEASRLKHVKILRDPGYQLHEHFFVAKSRALWAMVLQRQHP